MAPHPVPVVGVSIGITGGYHQHDRLADARPGGAWSRAPAARSAGPSSSAGSTGGCSRPSSRRIPSRSTAASSRWSRAASSSLQSTHGTQGLPSTNEMAPITSGWVMPGRRGRLRGGVGGAAGAASGRVGRRPGAGAGPVPADGRAAADGGGCLAVTARGKCGTQRDGPDHLGLWLIRRPGLRRARGLPAARVLPFCCTPLSL